MAVDANGAAMGRTFPRVDEVSMNSPIERVFEQLTLVVCGWREGDSFYPSRFPHPSGQPFPRCCVILGWAPACLWAPQADRAERPACSSSSEFAACRERRFFPQVKKINRRFAPQTVDS